MSSQPWESRITLVLCALLLVGSDRGALAAEKPVVKHPNLLLNRQEIAQMQAKIKQHEWASKLFGRVKELADEPGRTNHTPREAALVYVITGDQKYARAVRQSLLSNVQYLMPRYDKLDLQPDPDFGAWGAWATWAWAYDLTYDTFSDAERHQVERLFRTAARTIIDGLKLRSTTPNLVFEKHWKVGLIGYCLGDQELIDWALKDPGHHGPRLGGLYPVLDTMIQDKYFWGEAPIYALHYDLHGMLALAEAGLHHDGTDLYHYVSPKSGASIKGLIDGYLLLSFPLERTGVGKGSLRLATFGDGSTNYSPLGQLWDTFLVNPVSGAFGDVALSGELEVAYKRYRDPGYAWLLSLNPRRDQYIGAAGQGHNRPIWGYSALTHGEPLPEHCQPPAAPSGVYASQGVAMLRSDETSAYWSAGGLAAVVRLGAAVGHGHKDYFELILHGKGRLLYPDLNIIQYEPTFLNWTHEGIAHNTLLVDGQSPQPGPCTTRHDFASSASFFAISGSAYQDIDQTRALLMTPEYLVDVFRAADRREQEHTFDWVVHGLGRLSLSNPAAYRDTHALLPSYWWVDHERGRTTSATWQADWLQRSAGVTPGLQAFGPDWFEHPVGVRLTMLGTTGTGVYAGAGPITNGPPSHRIEGNPEGSSPLVVARRQAPTVTFAAIHEPYERRPVVTEVRRIRETADALGMDVKAAAFHDRVLLAFTPEQTHTLSTPQGESFVFRDHAFIRSADGKVTVRGDVRAFRMLAADKVATTATINGKMEQLRMDGAT